MAPVAIDGLVSPFPPVLVSVLVSFLVAVSLLLVISLCCCGRKAKEDDNTDDGIHVQMYWRSPYFCEICSRRYIDVVCPAGENTFVTQWWFENRNELMAPRAPDYGQRLHYFEHGEGRVDEGAIEKLQRSSKPRDKQKYRDTIEQHKTMYEMGRQSAMSRQPGRPPAVSGRDEPRSPAGFGSPSGSRTRQAPPAPAEPTAFKSGRNPAYGTLYGAKSNVFDQQGKKGCAIKTRRGAAQTMAAGEDQMRAAQANPAYQTIWNAKSGVFDKPGGGAAGGGGPGRGPQMSMAGPDEGKMQAAAANPAYGTLYGAASGVFDQQGGGGGGGGRGGGAMPAASNYRS